MMKVLAISALAAVASASGFERGEWTYVRESLDTTSLRFQVAMPSRNLDKLYAEIEAISNPKNPRYGQWKTIAEVNELTGTDAATRATVRSWLEDAGVTCEDRPTSLKCVGTVEQVESLLAVDVAVFEHLPSGKRIHRVHPTKTATFPAHIADKVTMITGLADFPNPKRRMGHPHDSPEATDYVVVVETLFDFYNTPQTGVATSTVITSPAEFQDYPSFSTADLTTFASQSNVNNWVVSNKIGPFQPNNPQPESTLDVQYIGSIGQNLTQWYWTETDWMYEFSEDLLNSTKNPDVISISWGWWELDQCAISPVGPCTNKSNSVGFVEAVNANFAKATAAGVTLVVAAGDNGAHGATDPTCKSPITRPDWPAASPWVLTVGATQIANGVSNGAKSPICQKTYQCATGGSEIVCSTATGALITTGGGFSDVAVQPSWQSAAVATYLKSNALLPPAADYNPGNRGYPDVAAIGHSVYIQEKDEGGALLVDGTSCSAPIWGGVIGQLNAARVVAGKSKLGFFNTALYQLAAETPAAFTDITIGNNTCTEDGCKKGCTGYGATVGWDANSGWGTPVYPQLLAAVLALP